MSSQKSICIPVTPPVDVSNYLPVIDHGNFQRLRNVRQLGINDLVFPGARHSRFEHAIGTLALTQRLCSLHGLSQGESNLLQCFALLHDIGHGPYSHQLEPILAGNHHTHGLEQLEEMAPAIRASGISPKDVMELLDGSNPLAIWITDRNLGTDKLDYLRRDAWHIGFQGVPDIERIQFYTHHRNGILSLDERLLEDGKQLQRFYSYLHQHGYLNKTALTAQRMLQRAVQEELALAQDSGDALWRADDSALMEWLRHAHSPRTQKLMAALDNRELFKTFLTLKPIGYGFVEKTAGKELMTLECSRKELSRLAGLLGTQDKVINAENMLAEHFGLSQGDILLSPMPYFTKLIPRDLMIFTGENSPEFSLFEKDHDHVSSLESDYLRTFAIRLACPPEHRSRLFAEAPGAAQLLLAL